MSIKLGLESLGIAVKQSTEVSSTEAIIDLNGAIVIANMSAEGISLKFDKVTDLVDAFDTVVEINRCVNKHNKTKSLEALYDASTITGSCEGFKETAKNWLENIKKFFVDIFNAIVEWFKQLLDKNTKLLKQLESVGAELKKVKTIEGEISAKSWTYEEMNKVLDAVTVIINGTSNFSEFKEETIQSLKDARSAEVKDGKLAEKKFDSVEKITKVLDAVTVIIKKIKDDKKIVKTFEAKKVEAIKDAETLVKDATAAAEAKKQDKVSDDEKAKIEAIKKEFKLVWSGFKAAEETAQAVAAQILAIANKVVAASAKKK